MSVYDALSCSTRVSSSANNKESDDRPLQGTSNKYSTSQRHTFVLIAEQYVLAHQLVPLRLHILDFIMVLGEVTIKLRLEHGGVLPGLGDFFIQ
jgi:hypothetical protein